MQEDDYDDEVDAMFVDPAQLQNFEILEEEMDEDYEPMESGTFLLCLMCLRNR